MTVEKLREAYDARPFLPFIVRLADDHPVPVRHTENMAFLPTGRTVIVYHGDDRHSMIDLPPVTRLEVTGNTHASAFYRAVGFTGATPVATPLGAGVRMHLSIPDAR